TTDALFTGEIFFSFGDDFFPEKNWNDFLNVILNWWLVELIGLLEKKSISAELNFMDGPFKIMIVTGNKNDTWELKFIESRKNTSVFSKEIIRDHFLKSIQTELNSLLRFYELHSVTYNHEIEKLKENFTRFHQLIRFNN